MPSMTGRVIAGRYNLQHPIGRGAMGVVWRARDQLLDRDVAIKEVVISAMISADERRNAYRRTLREARTAARLSHRGVVTVYDVVEEDGRPWIVMELVPSQSLDQVLSVEGRMPPARAGRIGQQLLSALAAAHAAGVLHRDVKPSNVLISSSRSGEGWEERAVLTDFGIAQFEGDPRLTQTGMVMGSPGFTAPERIRGGDATPGSDLWSLGATIYAAVEGRGPYEQRGGAITTMSAIINEDAPVAPHAGSLAPLIASLLRREPSTRPSASAAARMFAQMLPMMTAPDAAEQRAGTHPVTIRSSFTPLAASAPRTAPEDSAEKAPVSAEKPAQAEPVTDKPVPDPPAETPSAQDKDSTGDKAGEDKPTGDDADLEVADADAAGSRPVEDQAADQGVSDEDDEPTAEADAEEAAVPEPAAVHAEEATDGEDDSKAPDKAAVKPAAAVPTVAAPQLAAAAAGSAAESKAADIAVVEQPGGTLLDARPAAEEREPAGYERTELSIPVARSSPSTPVKPKPVQPKTAEPKPVQPKTVQPRTVEPKTVEPKAVAPKAVAPKTVEPKTVPPRPVQPKPPQPKPGPTFTAVKPSSRPTPSFTAGAPAPPVRGQAGAGQGNAGSGSPLKAGYPAPGARTPAPPSGGQYPPPSGQYPPPSTQYAGPAQPRVDLASQYVPGLGGGRANRTRGRGRQLVWLAVAMLIAAAIGVGAALALHGNGNGGGSETGASRSVHGLVADFQLVDALNDSMRTLPAGWPTVALAQGEA